MQFLDLFLYHFSSSVQIWSKSRILDLIGGTASFIHAGLRLLFSAGLSRLVVEASTWPHLFPFFSLSFKIPDYLDQRITSYSSNIQKINSIEVTLNKQHCVFNIGNTSGGFTQMFMTDKIKIFH